MNGFQIFLDEQLLKVTQVARSLHLSVLASYPPMQQDQDGHCRVIP